VASRCGCSLWRLPRVALRGATLSPVFFPERRRTAPRAAGQPEAEEAVLNTADGEHAIVWHVPPREGHPIFLYFHGNGGSLRWREERFRSLTADGSGLVL